MRGSPAALEGMQGFGLLPGVMIGKLCSQVNIVLKETSCLKEVSGIQHIEPLSGLCRIKQSGGHPHADWSGSARVSG